MPALKNPRHEAFAQAIFKGITNGQRETYSNGTAYQRAGYLPSNRNAADACASRLLRKVKPITDRVRELQAQQLAKIQPKLDLTRERVGRNLDEASRMAKQQENPTAIVAAETSIAKVFGLTSDTNGHNHINFNDAQSMQDIGKKLLQSVGFASPDDASIQAAIEANDVFIARLEAIRDGAQTLTIE